MIFSPIVLDTNALISGLLSKNGSPGQILNLLISSEKFRLVFDDNIWSEYESVVHRSKFKFDPSEVSKILKILEWKGVLISTPPPWPHTVPDPDDEIFLSVANKANISLITGNISDYPLRARNGVKILTPREFMETLKTHPFLNE